MQRIKVHRVKPRKQRTVIYEGVILVEEPGHLLVHARWERRAMDLNQSIRDWYTYAAAFVCSSAATFSTAAVTVGS